MKRTTDKNILIAFLLNIIFAIIELLGGLFTKSISILSDAIHDFIDAISIGISFFLERKSKKNPNNNYTYGYIRYSVLGALIATLFLILGSVLIKITNINYIDSIMSIIIASYILFHSLINLNEILAVFLEKTPKNIDIICLKNHLLNIKGIIEVHHFHV